MGPEFFDPKTQDHCRTKCSDSYTLGMVAYEVLSGCVPFYQYPNWVIPRKVLRGDRPERPQGREGVWFTNDLWEVLEHCWRPQPGSRPSIEHVLRCLKNASKFWIPIPQLPAVTSLVSSATLGSSNIFTAEDTDRWGESFPSRVIPSQPPWWGDPEESQEPIEQPAMSKVLQALLALGETGLGAEDDVMARIREPSSNDTWDYIEDAPESSTFDSRGGG